MEVTFDFANEKAIFTINGKSHRYDIKVITIDHYWKMASINYVIGPSFKWTISWSLYANREQFISFDKYEKVNEKDDPWTTLGKWSYISKPQAGTIQNTNINTIEYDYEFFNQNGNIKVFILNNKYGDWRIENPISRTY